MLLVFGESHLGSYDNDLINCINCERSYVKADGTQRVEPDNSP